jgi:hypothetical protein
MVERTQLEQAFADLHAGRVDEVAISRRDFDGLTAEDHQWLVNLIYSLVTKERAGAATRGEDGVLRIRLVDRPAS